MKPNYLILTIGIILFSSSVFAGELPKGSLMCGDESEMKEAVRAVQARDTHWLESLPMCLLTNQDLKAQEIDCDNGYCKVRFWVQGETAIGYTLKRAVR